MGTPHRLPIRVYYEDTDFSGAVYHAGYLRFLERGRTEMLRDLGISQTDLFSGQHGRPLAFVVTRMDIAFRSPARMDDLVVAETRTTGVRGASLTMVQRLWRDAILLVDATVTIAGVSNGRVARLPASLASRLAETIGGETGAAGVVKPILTLPVD